MSRSGYSDDCDQWDLIRWRGAVFPQHLGHYGCPNCHGKGLR